MSQHGVHEVVRMWLHRQAVTGSQHLLASRTLLECPLTQDNGAVTLCQGSDQGRGAHHVELGAGLAHKALLLDGLLQAAAVRILQ